MQDPEKSYTNTPLDTVVAVFLLWLMVRTSAKVTGTCRYIMKYPTNVEILWSDQQFLAAVFGY